MMQKANTIGAEDVEELMVNFDGKELKVHPNFKAYFCTKISNPN